MRALVVYSQLNGFTWAEMLHGLFRVPMVFYSLYPSYTLYLRGCPVCLVRFFVLFCLVYRNLLAVALMELVCVKCTFIAERWQRKKQAHTYLTFTSHFIAFCLSCSARPLLKFPFFSSSLFIPVLSHAIRFAGSLPSSSTATPSATVE